MPGPLVMTDDELELALVAECAPHGLGGVVFMLGVLSLIEPEEEHVHQ